MLLSVLFFSSRAQGQQPRVRSNDAPKVEPRPESTGGAIGGKESRVTVRVRGTGQVLSEPELATSVLSGEVLNEPGANAARVLSRSPGVQVQRAGGGSDLATVSIRGASASQVPVYLAGVRLNDDLVGVADLNSVPLWMVERIEIFRSTTPLHVPRSGQSGAIVFGAQTASRSQIRIGAMAGSFSSGALWAGGSYTYGAARDGQVSQLDSRISGGTSISIRRESARNDYEYRDDAGTAFGTEDDEVVRRKNADASWNDIWVTSQVNLPAKRGNVRLTLVGNHFEREQGVGGLSLFPTEKARISKARDLLGFSASIPCRVLSLSCLVKMTTSASFSSLITNDPADEVSEVEQRVDQFNSRSTNQLMFQVETNDKVTLALSSTYESSILKQDSSVTDLIRAKEGYFGAVASIGYSPREDIFIRGAGRATCVTSSGEQSGGQSEGLAAERGNECLPEGRLGATFSLKENLSLRASVARGVRFPTLGERFGLSASQRGNPALRREEAWSADLGATFLSQSFPWGELRGEASVFGRLADDLVAYRRSSLGYVRPFNVEQGRFLGTELGGELNTFQHIRISSQLSIVDPRNIHDGKDPDPLVPFRSPFVFNQELEFYGRRLENTVSSWGVIGYATYRSARTADPIGLVVLPGQLVIDLALHLEIKQKIDLRIRAENLSGADRLDSLGYPLSGRALFASLELKN